MTSQRDVNVVDIWQRTSLCYAIEHCHLDVIEYLVNQRGASVNKVPGQVWSPLHRAASNGNLECMKFLLKKGAKQDDYSAFRGAIVEGHLECVKYFVEQLGIDVNKHYGDDNNDGSPLTYAIDNYEGDIIRFLLINGANPFNHKSNDSELSKHESRLLVVVMRKTFRERQSIQAMLSVNLYPRLGQNSALNVLPTDLIRRLHTYFV
jgi:ankyrin repeat protein